MSTVRDHLWIFSHREGSYNNEWGLPGDSRITPAEAAYYLNVPNLIMVGYKNLPRPPFDRYAISFRPLARVVWAVVGEAGRSSEADRQHVLDLAARFPNIVGVYLDDFFQTADGAPAMTEEELAALKEKLTVQGRRLGVWLTFYDQMLAKPVWNIARLCDCLTFWTWRAADLADLEKNFAELERRSAGRDIALGCYMWDFGEKKPMPLSLMEKQCALGLEWLRAGRIREIVFLASCLCDLELETVEWTRAWIDRVKDEDVPATR